MPDIREDRSLSDAIAAQTIGDEASRFVLEPMQQALEETPRGSAVPPVLHQYVQHDAMLVDSAPQIVQHAPNADEGKTPTTALGVTTVNTEQLASMLKTQKPLVIDTMGASWYCSVPGAVGLDISGFTHGSFTDAVQKRLEQKLRALTGDDMAKPIVAISFNVARFDGYNLALRLRHAGYTNVYRYRGGREAWELAGMPEDVVRPADW